eukprot:9802069-Lingulodinium_polyedra.AAC.1
MNNQHPSWGNSWKYKNEPGTWNPNNGWTTTRAHHSRATYLRRARGVRACGLHAFACERNADSNASLCG